MFQPKTTSSLPLSLFCYFILLLLGSCDRSVDFVPAVEPLPTDIFRTNEITLTEFQVKAEEGDTLELEDSTNYQPTVLIIPENLCVYGNGDPCEGDMDVQLIQAFTKADMIFADIPTTSKRMPLESGGAFYVNITQGGEQLYIRPDAVFQIKAATARTPGDPQKMKFYRLDEVANQVFDWRLQGDLAAVDDTYYTLEFNELDRWMNIDYEIPTDISELSIKVLQNENEIINAQVFFSLDNFNSVGKAEYQAASKIYRGFIPESSPVQLVAIRKDGNNWAWHQSEVTPGVGELELELQPIPYQQLVNALKNL